MPLKRPSPIADVAADLLAWYDAHARALPWRALPGAAADPYRVWLSEVMLQQTTVAAVRPRFERWTARWPDFAALAAATDAEIMAAWAGLGYYARARNLVAAARIVAAEHDGRLPDTEEALRRLPGLGAYTAAAVAAIAFGRRAVVVDANVERVVARLFALPEPLPQARPAIRAAADAITPDERAGDFAQAMMDLGATICTLRGPRCLLCPVRGYCAGFASGAPEAFPGRKAKKTRPQRYGTIFWLERSASPSPFALSLSKPVLNNAAGGVEGGRPSSPPEEDKTRFRQAQPARLERDGEILLVRRPAKGLLGGMRALPTGPWSDAPPGLTEAPAVADWRILDTRVRHGFTHFDLDLALAVAAAPAHLAAVDGEWWPVTALAGAGLPTLFAKAAAAMENER